MRRSYAVSAYLLFLTLPALLTRIPLYILKTLTESGLEVITAASTLVCYSLAAARIVGSVQLIWRSHVRAFGCYERQHGNDQHGKQQQLSVCWRVQLTRPGGSQLKHECQDEGGAYLRNKDRAEGTSD